MQAECNWTQLMFEGFANRQVVGAFDGGAVTSNSGALLLREADRRIGLTTVVARCLIDRRNPDAVAHTIETLVAQRIHAQALDYEDLNDHDVLQVMR
jgi:Transposase DDE domain group 1